MRDRANAVVWVALVATLTWGVGHRDGYFTGPWWNRVGAAAVLSVLAAFAVVVAAVLGALAVEKVEDATHGLQRRKPPPRP